MRLSPIVPTLALLLLPAALGAQSSTPAGGDARPAGCRGTNTQTSNTTLVSESGVRANFPSYPEIEEVQPNSPAERAGFKIGDMVILQDGRDLIANPPTRRFLAGDTVQFVVRRNGAEVPLTVVLGRWDPPQESPGVERVCRPMGTSATGS